MTDFGNLQRMSLRQLWTHEAHGFTPWLAENIGALGEALGMELELADLEAPVGDFSLDLLANDLGSGGQVVIENQLRPTDHDHLGKLLTYAAGFGAEKLVWIAESIREEHRQALEWLNQRTDKHTQFFAVTVEALRIDDSRPAYNFKTIVFPNEWQKLATQKNISPASKRGEKYRVFYQQLIDELRERHRFTGARAGQPQNWYAFASGHSGINYGFVFGGGGRVRVEVYIDLGDAGKNETVFEQLASDRKSIEADIGHALDWEPLNDKRASRIALSAHGSIDDDAETLATTHDWAIENLLRFKRVFTSRLKHAVMHAAQHVSD